MPQEVKYCRDCHFSRNKYAQATDWQCVSPKNILYPVIISYLTGESEPMFVTAQEARFTNTSGCGPEAKWFMTTNEYLATKLTVIHGYTLNTSQKRTTNKIGIDDI